MVTAYMGMPYIVLAYMNPQRLALGNLGVVCGYGLLVTAYVGMVYIVMAYMNVQRLGWGNLGAGATFLFMPLMLKLFKAFGLGDGPVRGCDIDCGIGCAVGCALHVPSPVQGLSIGRTLGCRVFFSFVFMPLTFDMFCGVIYTHGLDSYGLNSYGLNSDGLCSYGPCSYGLNSYGL